jgi:hypothetical protein
MTNYTSSKYLLAQKAFWAAHMWNVTKGPVSNSDADTVDAIIGLASNDIEDFYTTHLCNNMIFPCFCIALGDGYSIEIEYFNQFEDHQLLYRICNNNWEDSICIGSGGGNWQLPAFSWTELVLIAHAASKVQDNPCLNSACALLLLLPSAWISNEDNLDFAQKELYAAWTTLNFVPQERLALLIKHLVSSIHTNIQWHYHSDYGWINDSDNSTRNPASSARLNRNETLRIKTFIDSLYG